MHRVKNVNFSVRVPELHSVFHVIFLLVALHPLLVVVHPLTGIEQVIYRRKAAVNTQLSRVDHFFILITILKVFHLKFIQHSSWTSCYFRVEILWRIFVCTRASTSLCTNPTFIEILKTAFFHTKNMDRIFDRISKPFIVMRQIIWCWKAVAKPLLPDDESFL